MLWFFKNKRERRKHEKEQKGSNVSSVAQYAATKNAQSTVRNEVMRELQTRYDHTPLERFNLLVKSYRASHDVIVVPEAWKDSSLHNAEFQAQEAFTGRKIFVETPSPAIVRTR